MSMKSRLALPCADRPDEHERPSTLHCFGVGLYRVSGRGLAAQWSFSVQGFNGFRVRGCRAFLMHVSAGERLALSRIISCRCAYAPSSICGIVWHLNWGSPVPAQMMGGVSPVPAQMMGGVGPVPGQMMGGVSPVPAQMWAG